MKTVKTRLENPGRRSLLAGAGVAAAIGLLGRTSAIAGDKSALAGDGSAIAANRRAAKLFSTEAGAGKNVILLHGWTADSSDWLWQIPALESRYRVVAVDLRGHGRSEIMPSGMYTPDDYLGDIESFIATRYPGERFVAIGHSMGAQIAARLAAKRPDQISAVVSIDGSLGFPAEVERLFSKVAIDLKRRDPHSVAAGLFDLVYDPATDPAYRRWHARRLMGVPDQVIRESFGPLFKGAGQVGIGTQSEVFLPDTGDALLPSVPGSGSGVTHDGMVFASPVQGGLFLRGGALDHAGSERFRELDRNRLDRLLKLIRTMCRS